MIDDLNSLASEVYTGTDTYSDLVHFVHIYTIEAHPQSPEPMPYSGAPSPCAYSNGPQPKTYSARVTNAQAMETLLTSGTHIMLVDDLTPEARNNPVWYTYGPNPNGGYLIGRDGLMKSVQKWLSVSQMKSEIDALLN